MLLDLRHAPFSHGHTYVAVSRVHVAADCSAFIDDSCCVERRGGRCAVMGSVVYDELLRSPQHRVHLYGATPFWCHLHLGESREQERLARPPISTAAFYAEDEKAEAVRFVRFLRLKPSPQRFSV